MAKVGHGREVRRSGVGVTAAEEGVCEEEVREFRKHLGVQVEEASVDPGRLQLLDQLLYRYRGVFAELEQELGCATEVEHEVHLTSEVYTD